MNFIEVYKELVLILHILILIIAAEDSQIYPELYTPKYDHNLFHKLYEALISENYDEKLAGVIEIRELVTSPNPPYEGLERTAVLRRIVEFFSYEKDDIRYESALTIATLCSKGYSYLVVEAGGIFYLGDILLSNNMTILQQGVLAAGYIMGHNPEFRDHCVTEGVVFPLTWHVSSTKTPDYILKNISWALSNLCKGTDEYMDEEAIKEILPTLATLIQHNDPEVVKNAAAAYAFLAAGGGKFIQIVIDSGRIGNVIALLNHTDEKIQYAAAGAVSIFFTGSPQQIQHIIDHGALPHLVKLLIHPNPKLKNNSLKAIYNLVLNGKSKQIQALLNLNVISLICDLLDNCSRIVVKTSLDIIHTLLGKSEEIREIIGQHVNEWGGFEKMENVMEKTIARLHNEDNNIDQGTCTR